MVNIVLFITNGASGNEKLDPIVNHIGPLTDTEATLANQ